MGTADYDGFGEVGANSGAGSVFGFTSEQFQPETSFTFLRARYEDRSLVPFLSANSVQPNAPGCPMVACDSSQVKQPPTRTGHSASALCTTRNGKVKGRPNIR
jgi:hypothetical protein